MRTTTHIDMSSHAKLKNMLNYIMPDDGVYMVVITLNVYIHNFQFIILVGGGILEIPKTGYGTQRA